jgi:ribonuclease HII
MISEAESWAGSRWNSRKPPEKNKREERENKIKYTYKTGDIQKMRKISSEKLEQELKRLEQMREYERKYEEYSVICGIDEAGRGPLAGPVVAAAAVLPKDAVILWLNDSKKLSERRREELFLEIREKAVAYGVGIVSPAVIDEINILQATYEAMRQAVSQLPAEPDIFLNDAVMIPGIDDKKQVRIIKGDAKSVSIAAASVLAKVTRDHMMEEYDKLYPEYGFAKHKGYGTKAHMDAIREFGVCPIHRRSFLTKMDLKNETQ